MAREGINALRLRASAPRLSALVQALVFSAIIAEVSVIAFGQVRVVSGASLGQAVAPGSVASILGDGLASTTAVPGPNDSGRLPLELAGTSVLVAGTPCPL